VREVGKKKNRGLLGTRDTERVKGFRASGLLRWDSGMLKKKVKWVNGTWEGKGSRELERV